MYVFANEGILNNEDVNSLDLELDELFGDDLQMALESVSQVTSDIDAMMRHVSVLETACHTGSDKDKRSVLKACQLHRESVTRYYDYDDSVFTKVMAVESVSNENLVFAMEE